MNAAPAPDRSAARELPFLSHQPLRRLAREQSGELTVAFARFVRHGTGCAPFFLDRAPRIITMI
jgi:hypothetical protein